MVKQNLYYVIPKQQPYNHKQDKQTVFLKTCNIMVIILESNAGASLYVSGNREQHHVPGNRRGVALVSKTRRMCAGGRVSFHIVYKSMPPVELSVNCVNLVYYFATCSIFMYGQFLFCR